MLFAVIWSKLPASQCPALQGDSNKAEDGGWWSSEMLVDLRWTNVAVYQSKLHNILENCVMSWF
jgi:hypothetical protein